MSNNDYWHPTSKPKRDWGFGSVQSKKTSLNPMERQRLQDIGRSLRSASGGRHQRLIEEADRLIGNRELTAADARMIALYAKSGSAAGANGDTGISESWGEALNLLRDAQDTSPDSGTE
ncbi:hypothetical protein Q3V30_22640 (plasmid) [Erwinia pyri]|uniref:Uncharacterized protein n=1 Tax=Erwinia pyri TaxID=3062598 RepID=A0AA50HT34_9GAMM|nr:hypothetical protein [Erwinia sp. DE2]WLS81263.1 hypothetical protein Q3V30_22640 [Erwinia sp. DE2]